jgi:decaprenyl-phosphate phosphoribosyltransferase
MRPRQWVKNVLVAAAPLAAGTLTQPRVLLHTATAFVALALASSATYCLNDAMDAEADSLHPVKSRRPIPSGLLTSRVAVVLASVLAAAALLVAGLASSWGPLSGVVVAYLVVTAAYSIALKHQPVLELGLISAGFVLRAIAGGVATGIPLSQWFLIVTGFGSLYMVAGKRLSELVRAQHENGAVRRAVAHYPLSYLRGILAISASVAIAGYCLWAADVAAHHGNSIWVGVSVFPFVLALLRYGLDADGGQVEEPEEVVIHDRTLQGLGLLWLLTYAAGVLL